MTAICSHDCSCTSDHVVCRWILGAFAMGMARFSILAVNIMNNSACCVWLNENYFFKFTFWMSIPCIYQNTSITILEVVIVTSYSQVLWSQSHSPQNSVTTWTRPYICPTEQTNGKTKFLVWSWKHFIFFHAFWQLLTGPGARKCFNLFQEHMLIFVQATNCRRDYVKIQQTLHHEGSWIVGEGRECLCWT